LRSPNIFTGFGKEAGPLLAGTLGRSVTNWWRHNFKFFCGQGKEKACRGYDDDRCWFQAVADLWNFMTIQKAARTGAEAPGLSRAQPKRRTKAVPASASGPFWRRKGLAEMTRSEWESLCDGCGRCCLIKLEDEDAGDIHFTDIACRLFDSGTCRCSDYAHRAQRVKDCVRLTPRRVAAIPWLPPTCAYRLIAEGKDLFAWHPLVSGNPASVHAAGISARGKVSCLEDEIPIEDYVDHVVAWPVQSGVAKKMRRAKDKGSPEQEADRAKRRSTRRPGA
jgi:uncharacterized protein